MKLLVKLEATFSDLNKMDKFTRIKSFFFINAQYKIFRADTERRIFRTMYLGAMKR